MYAAVAAVSRTALPKASQLKLEERNWPVDGLNVRAGPSIVVNRTAAGKALVPTMPAAS